MHAFDAKNEERQRQKRAWSKAKAGERHYAAQLRAVAEQVGKLVQGMPPEDPSTLVALENALRKYSVLIEPWAKAVAARMIADVSKRDEGLWQQLHRDMGRALKQELKHAPTGEMLREMLAENVTLITSLPLDAAKRVHEWALRGIEQAERPDVVKAEIMKTGLVTESRARLIARTEVSRVASGLVEARAQYVGSEGYIWRSVGDSDVRNKDGNPIGSHRLLNGKFIRWDSPPVAATNGTRAHAGQIYNCRCWPDPVIPMEF